MSNQMKTWQIFLTVKVTVEVAEATQESPDTIFFRGQCQWRNVMQDILLHSFGVTTI